MFGQWKVITVSSVTTVSQKYAHCTQANFDGKRTASYSKFLWIHTYGSNAETFLICIVLLYLPHMSHHCDSSRHSKIIRKLTSLRVGSVSVRMSVIWNPSVTTENGSTGVSWQVGKLWQGRNRPIFPSFTWAAIRSDSTVAFFLSTLQTNTRSFASKIPSKIPFMPLFISAKMCTRQIWCLMHSHHF